MSKVVRLPILHVQRPRTRGECANVPRPCPFVSCKYNNYLHVEGDRLKIPSSVDPDEVDPRTSCALDVAEYEGATLDDIAHAFGVSRERVRQIESKALAKVSRRAHLSDLSDWNDVRRGEVASPSNRSICDLPTDDSVDDQSDLYARGSFFGADDLAACNGVWNAFVKSSNGRGIDARPKNSITQSRVRKRHGLNFKRQREA